MSCDYLLASVVSELCERAGLPFGKFDATRLEGFVDGMQVTNEQPVYQYIEELSKFYFFDPSNHSGVQRFVHRGAQPVLTIQEGDIIGDSTDEVTRKSPEEIVKVLHLNYYDKDGGAETDQQTSSRGIDTRGEGEESVDTGLVLETDFAARQVIIAHKVMIEEQRGEVNITLPENYLNLVVGDVVVFRDDRLRVDEVSIDDGKQSYILKHDRKSAYESTVFGVPPIKPVDPISRVPGATTIQFIDAHILSSGDDSQLGYYMAISGASAAWRGAFIELSYDGGQNYIESKQRTSAAIMGELLTPLLAARREVPDQKNTIQVRIDTFGVSLESRTLEEMLNRENRAIIGDEIINFGNAVELAPGVWEISYFLRGRLGSDIPSSHPAGTRFVLLERNFLEYVPVDEYNINQSLTFRATSLNSASETIITETFIGRSQIERAPSQLRAVRTGGNLVITWVGTGRIGGRGRLRMGQNFEGYQVDINGTTTNTLEQSLSMPDPGGSLTIRVSQLNSITGAGQAAEITL